MARRHLFELVDRVINDGAEGVGTWFSPTSEFTSGWWDAEDALQGSPNERWISVTLRGSEVARVKLDLHPGPESPQWRGEVPEGQVEIAAFEVAATRRGEGIGKELVMEIRELYPQQFLTAWTMEAAPQGFWGAIGWKRDDYENPFLGPSTAAAYLCPPGWS